jgi:hypothetical protein
MSSLKLLLGRSMTQIAYSHFVGHSDSRRSASVQRPDRSGTGFAYPLGGRRRPGRHLRRRTGILKTPVFAHFHFEQTAAYGAIARRFEIMEKWRRSTSSFFLNQFLDLSIYEGLLKTWDRFGEVLDKSLPGLLAPELRIRFDELGHLVWSSGL